MTAYWFIVAVCLTTCAVSARLFQGLQNVINYGLTHNITDMNFVLGIAISQGKMCYKLSCTVRQYHSYFKSYIIFYSNYNISLYSLSVCTMSHITWSYLSNISYRYFWHNVLLAGQLFLTEKYFTSKRAAIKRLRLHCEVLIQNAVAVNQDDPCEQINS